MAKRELTDEQKAARLEYMRAWQAKNREKSRQYVRDYYQRNKEKAKEKLKRQRAENPERFRAWERKYRLTEKYKAARTAPEFLAERAAYARAKRAARTPEERQAKRDGDRVIRFRIYAKVARIKAERGCLQCGERDPLVLDFNHRDRSQKEYTIARILTKEWDVIAAEIAKCDVLCSNCHRRHHRPKWYDWMLANPTESGWNLT